MIALGVLLWLLILRSVGGKVYEIRVTDDGTVEFMRLWKRFWPSERIAAHRIRAIEGKWDSTADGDPFWEFAVEHAGGRIPLPTFGNEEVFIAHLQALNPAIKLRGQGGPSNGHHRQSRPRGVR